LRSLKALLSILLQTSFLSIKSTFWPLKRNPKHTLKMNKKHFWQKLKNEAFAQKLFLLKSSISQT
jgi:hypothetical protein